MSAPARAVGIGADFHHSDQNSFAGGGGNCATPGSSSGSGVQQGTVLTRTLYVHITGTLANLAMAGPSGGTWKLVDGKGIGVFGMGAEVDSQVSHLSNLPFWSSVC